MTDPKEQGTIPPGVCVLCGKQASAPLGNMCIPCQAECDAAYLQNELENPSDPERTKSCTSSRSHTLIERAPSAIR